MGTFLYNLFIYPIEMIVEFVFIFFYKGFKNPGLAIAAISVVVTILSLPLYNIAHNLQKKERDVRMKMQSGIQRIKAAFKGDEQYMMLSTFYRQNNYHPVYALRSSVSLLIQVPFFIAAYHYLNNVEQLQGASFFFIHDLGSPDGLLAVGMISINVLPIFMTIINVIAGVIYTKGFPSRDKIQLYTMAGLFLVLLYNSPSGLVLYWTFNNVFSLIKNLFYRLKHPLKIFYAVTAISTVVFTVFMVLTVGKLTAITRLILIVACSIVVSLPLLLRGIDIIYSRYLFAFESDKKIRNSVFILSALLMFLLLGVIVPSSLISSSPVEFSFTGILRNPLIYVLNTATIFFGIFIIWGGFIFVLSKEKIKTLFATVMSLISFSALINLFLFRGDYGFVSRLLQFDNPALLTPSKLEIIAPFLLLCVCFVLVLILLKEKKGNVLSLLLTILTLTSFVSGIVMFVSIDKEFDLYKDNIILLESERDPLGTIEPAFHLSQAGKNVIVLFLDRAISGYFPVILEQFPDVKEQFKGFTFYPNTITFGNNTVSGAAAMVGGYEYTPSEMEKRSSEKMVDKHNEAILVMPKLFLDGGYSVTIADPPYSNYKAIVDFTPFNPYPTMNMMQHLQRFSHTYKSEHSDVINWDDEAESTIIKERLPMFSLLKTIFPVFRLIIYDKGSYFAALKVPYTFDVFLDSYSQLYYLDLLTDISAKGDTYTFIGNETTHEPVYLQAPEYEPRTIVTDKSTPLDSVEGISEVDTTHYHVNAATMKQLGKWFDMLQEKGVYDNSRIIIVADHGRDIYSPHFEDFENNADVYARLNPLLLVKDFNAKNDIQTDSTFMTNADTLLFAIADLGLSPLNPFTKKDVAKNVSKEEVEIFYAMGRFVQQTGNVFKFDSLKKYSVKDSIFNEPNWSLLGEK